MGYLSKACAHIYMVMLFLLMTASSHAEFKSQPTSFSPNQGSSELASSGQDSNQDLIRKCKANGGESMGVDFDHGGIRCSIQDSTGISRDYTVTNDFVQPVDGNGGFSPEASCINSGGQFVNGFCIQQQIEDDPLKEQDSKGSTFSADTYNGHTRSSPQISTFIPQGPLTQSAAITPTNAAGDPEQAKEFATAVTGHEVTTTSSEVCSNLEKQVAQCEERGKNTVSICDPNTNKDMVQFSQGMSGLNKMLAAAAQSGAANKMASCALSAGTNSLASLVTGDYGDSCQYEVSACRNVCEIGLDYLKTNAALAQSCASVAARAQRIFDSVYEKCSRSDVSTQAMKAVAGLGQNAMAGMKCAQDGGKKSDACLQNPIQCMFGDANCNNPSAANTNPVCFCKYKNPNDPMCAMLSKLEENPTQDMSNSSVLSAKDYNNGKELPLSPTGPAGDNEVASTLEELLAKHQAGPVGNVELQGKSGDGLGGGAGSVVGSSSNGAQGAGRAPASSVSTKVLAGFMSASSFGMSTITGKEPQAPNQKHRSNKYLRRLQLRHPKMPADQVLALAHRLALRDAKLWQHLHDAREQGQSEEKIVALRAVLEENLIIPNSVKMPTSDGFKPIKKEIQEEVGPWEYFLSFIQYHMKEGLRAFDHWNENPLLALLYGILALVPYAFLRAMGWILLPLIQAKRSAAGAESEKALRKNPITQILFTPEEQSYAKRRFQRYMATYQKDLAEGKITLKTHPNPPWKPADAHYSVIKFYLEKDRHFRKVLLAQKKQELKSEEKKKMFFLSSPQKIQEIQTTIQELLYTQEAYGDHEEFTAKDFQFEWIEDALLARREKFEPKAQQPMPVHFGKQFPFPSCIPANSSVLKTHAMKLGFIQEQVG